MFTSRNPVRMESKIQQRETKMAPQTGSMPSCIMDEGVEGLVPQPRHEAELAGLEARLAPLELQRTPAAVQRQRRADLVNSRAALSPSFRRCASSPLRAGHSESTESTDNGDTTDSSAEGENDLDHGDADVWADALRPLYSPRSAQRAKRSSLDSSLPCRPRASAPRPSKDRRRASIEVPRPRGASVSPRSSADGAGTSVMGQWASALRSSRSDGSRLERSPRVGAASQAQSYHRTPFVEDSQAVDYYSKPPRRPNEAVSRASTVGGSTVAHCGNFFGTTSKSGQAEGEPQSTREGSCVQEEGEGFTCSSLWEIPIATPTQASREASSPSVYARTCRDALRSRAAAHMHAGIRPRQTSKNLSEPEDTETSEASDAESFLRGQAVLHGTAMVNLRRGCTSNNWLGPAEEFQQTAGRFFRT